MKIWFFTSDSNARWVLWGWKIRYAHLIIWEPIWYIITTLYLKFRCLVPLRTDGALHFRVFQRGTAVQAAPSRTPPLVKSRHLAASVDGPNITVISDSTDEPHQVIRSTWNESFTVYFVTSRRFSFGNCTHKNHIEQKTVRDYRIRPSRKKRIIFLIRWLDDSDTAIRRSKSECKSCIRKHNSEKMNFLSLFGFSAATAVVWSEGCKSGLWDEEADRTGYLFEDCWLSQQDSRQLACELTKENKLDGTLDVLACTAAQDTSWPNGTVQLFMYRD